MENFIWGFLTAFILAILLFSGIGKVFWNYMTENERRIEREKKKQKEETINKIKVIK